MNKKLLTIVLIALFSLGLSVLANTIFNIDDAFFADTSEINSGDYSPLHFNFAGNDFDGLMFWGEDVTGNTGELILGTESVTCDKQLRGLYINTARGNKVWPLDEITLNELSGSANLSGYDLVTMTGGFFTECSGSGFTVNSDEIYGYITHEYDSETYELRAGIDYDFVAGVGTGVFSGSLKYITGLLNNSAEGYLFDDHGGIATVISSLDIYGNISFTGAEATLSGSEYYAEQTDIQVSLYSNLDVDFEITGDVASVITGTLSAGVSLDQDIVLSAGNGVKNIVFTVDDGVDTYTDTISIILDIPDTTDPVVSLINPINSGLIMVNEMTFHWTGSDDTAIDHYDMYLIGDYAYNRMNISSGTSSKLVSPLANDEYTWYVVATDTSGNTGQSATYSLIVSGSAVGPSLVNPINNADISIGDLLLSWTGTSTSGYVYQISTDTAFANIVSARGTDYTSIDPVHNPDFMTGVFYWRIIDLETNAISDYREVNIILPSGGLDLKVDDFDFDEVDDARLSESYNSNEIRIDGITSHVYIPIRLEDNVGALYINDVMVGTESFVMDGDDVYIELLSDSDYDERTSAELIIGEGDDEVSARFRVNTKDGDSSVFELTYGQKLQAISLVNALGDMYGSNESKLVDFLNTFLSLIDTKLDVLADEIDDDSSIILKGQFASFEYLSDVIKNYLDNIGHGVNDFYTAPNGKTYEVVVDSMGIHTSPDFIYPKFFPTWNSFKKHIDDRNPAMMSRTDNGNTHNSATIEGNTVIAPNGKTYEVYQNNDGLWTCDDFIYPTSFSTQAGIVKYIEINNR